MTWSFPVGRVLGSELRIHVTFFLLLAWVGFAAWAEGGPAVAIENLAFVLILFACVVAHEYGHALAARHYGIRTPDITLLPIGGLARLERMPENPRHEIVVALAGPLVNIVIWILLSLLGARASPGDLASLDGGEPDFLARLALINLFLALFNMIPAFPMDGGRVLRAGLSLVTDRVKATRAAAAAGQVAAILLGFAGLSTGNPILVLIAVFVFVAANAESQDVAMRAVTRRMLARDAMITSFEALAPGDSLQTAAGAVVRTTQHEFPVIDATGTLLGFVTRGRLLAALAGETPRSAPVAEIQDSDIPVVVMTTPLDQVLDLLHKGAPAVAVQSTHGRLAGYITREHIGELMVIRGR